MPVNICGEFCAVIGCEFERLKGRTSLHYFPKEKRRKQLWVNFVGKNRKWSGASSKTCLCSHHFVKSDFENWTKFNLGYAAKLILKKNAIPSIYPQKNKTPEARSAFRKREIARVSFHRSTEKSKSVYIRLITLPIL